MARKATTLHFDPAHPLPAALVRKLIRTRTAEPRSTTNGAM